MAVTTFDPPPLRAHLLGPVRLAVGNDAIAAGAWPRRTSRALLLLLLATPGHHLPRDRALDVLWPAAAGAAAANALYVALHGLRRVLEPTLRAGRDSAYVEARGEEVRLRLHPGLWVDVDVFEAACRRAASAPAGDRSASLREALALYVGDLLADEPAADWAAGRREELRRTWRRAALDYAALEREGGRPLAALAALERLAAADPCDEPANRAIMRALADADRREEALRRYAACVQALRSELDTEPSEATTALAVTIREAPPIRPAVAPVSVRVPRINNLPTPPNPLIGRSRELEALEDLLWDPDVRLATVSGPGGIGKTRLALEAAHAVAESFTDGVCFVGLASLRDPDLVIPTIARVLGIEEGRGRAAGDLLRERLRDRQLLLVLDNIEQVIEAAPDVAALLEACSRLKMLVTSREPLHVRAEHELPVPPLALPPIGLAGSRRLNAEMATRYEAVTLFVQRARAANPSFELTDRNVEAVASLCIRLDGLPLAIELAVARGRYLAEAELLTGATSRLALLVEGYRDLPPRQRTMRDAIAWSYELLEPAEQLLFRRLAVFAGGCTLEAAGWITTGGESSPVSFPETTPAAHDFVLSLVEKSLLLRQETDDAPRLVMLETIREFGLEQLHGSGEDDAVARRHAEYFLAFAEAAEAALWEAVQGPPQAAWLDRVQAEYDNLRLALVWADGHDAEMALRLAAALSFFWHERSYYREGRAWLERSLQRGREGPAPLRAKALHGASLLAGEQGDYVACAALGEEGLKLYRTLGDIEGIGRSLHVLAQAAGEQGAWERAADLAHESLALAQTLGHARGIVTSLRHLGIIAMQQGEPRRALALLDEALQIARDHRDRLGTVWVLLTRGDAHQALDDPRAAARAFRESLTLAREHGDLSDVTICVQKLALLATSSGQPELAAHLFGAAERLREAVAFAIPATDRPAYEHALAVTRAALGDERFQAAWASGRALPRAEAIATALIFADAFA